MRTWRELSTRAAPVRPIPAYQPSEADIEPARAGREAGAPADIRGILTSSAKRLGTGDRDHNFGSGLWLAPGVS